MAELAKTHITISDESAYAAGVDNLIPLFVFATEQDKVIDESTGEIALGTTKTLANEVSIVTSKKDVIEKFGVPTFVKENGTVKQDDERNEHGLYALYDAMGATSVAYALRADIDLKQLEPTSVKPTSTVKNGTMWLDMYNSVPGLFICNSEDARPAKAWDMITNIELVKEKPADKDGKEGEYAVSIIDGVQTFYYKDAESWKVVGENSHVFHDTSINYPQGAVKGDYWVKTTPASNGANYMLKRWSESASRWSEVSLPMFTSLDKVNEKYGEEPENGLYAFVCNEEDAGATLYMSMNKKWSIATNVEVSMVEPRAEAEEGTLWFNDELKVDIMVNNGTKWVGFHNADDCAEASIYVTSEEPTPVMENSLWINPSAEDYPCIKRYIGGDWELIDNTDQSTPDGILFADARYYADNNEEPTYKTSDDGVVESNLLTSDDVDPDAPEAATYPAGMLLFNTRFSTNNVKEYKTIAFEGMKAEEVPGKTLSRWVSASGNALDGSGLFGKKAQRAMVVRALAGAIASNEDIRSQDYDFFFATCPGYPEVDDELINLNADKKEMFEIISDTPKALAPNGKKIQEWGTNANNAASHGSEGRVLKNEFVTRQYPPMGLATNVDGDEIAVPSSVAKMKNLLVLPRGQICAGTQNGQVINLASVGYITDEGEYASVVINDGLGEVCTAQSINPIMPRRNTGLLFWGEATENPITSSLSDEHAIITVLRLKRQLEAACLPFFFRINNESLRAEFYRALQSVLNIFIGTGEIYDYALEVESENTAERINRKELWAAVAIEIAKGVEQIYIPIRVVSTGALSA